MIRVDDLVKRFGQTTAVAGISFEVAKGEVVGFLGPNGAGKTTTLRVLTCFHPATSGTASIAGHDVFAEPVQARRLLGYLPENVPIYGDLRVEEYLHYRAALKGVARRQRRAAVDMAMERADVTDVRRKLVAHVSRGYRQRVGLADALVARPPILILDEPTTGLDPIQRRRMKKLVRELAEEHTILFSSHILGEVQDVSTRILVIHQGTLRADGTPEALLQQSRGRRLVVTAALPEPELRLLLRGLPGVLSVGVTEPALVAPSSSAQAAAREALDVNQAELLADLARRVEHAAKSRHGLPDLEVRVDGNQLRSNYHLPDIMTALIFDAVRERIREKSGRPADDRYATVELPVAVNADPRDAAYVVLRAHDVAIRELQLRLPTLEEYFLQVTEGADVAPAAERAPA